MCISTIEICVGNKIFEVFGKSGPLCQNREGVRLCASGRC